LDILTRRRGFNINTLFCDKMKLSRILLTITFYLLRSLNGHTQLDLLVYQCSDNFLISDNVYNGKVYQCSDSSWIVESVDISPISYGNRSRLRPDVRILEEGNIGRHAGILTLYHSDTHFEALKSLRKSH